VHGPDPGRVPERRADLADQVLEVRFLDDDVRPEAILQLLFRERAGARVDEDREEIEGLRREPDARAAARELPRVPVEDELAEVDSHAGHLPKTC
jgi:hypothetical protein